MGLVVGIGGVSRAGKSTLASQISEMYPELKVQIINMDKFVLPQKDIPLIHGVTDWEIPESVDYPQLTQAVEESKLRTDLVLVEGILIYNDPNLLQKFDLKIFVDIPKSVFERRKKNDDRWEIPSWFMKHIWASYLKFGQVHKNECIIVNGTKPFDQQQIKNIFNL